MITLNHVTKKYNNHTVLNDVSLAVKRGEFFGFLGPNGAGKTTSIKALLGLVKPDHGYVIVDGIDVAKDPIGVRQKIGYVPDKPFLYDKLTAREFFQFVGGIYHMNMKEIIRRIDWLTSVFGMHEWIDRRTEEYSHGMKQKVVMSAAFLHRPALLIVDEPTVGLDPPSARQLKNMLSLIQSHGTTIFMSSHDLSVVEELCERMAILHQGSIVAEGTMVDLRKSAALHNGSLESLFMKLTDNVNPPVYLD